jgi:hypothetical protein
MLTIAIDFDDTLTAAPHLWEQFVSLARMSGHRVVCVTARRGTLENVEILDDWMRAHGIDLPVYYTSLSSKVDYMRSHGHKIDIWIDDDPRKCALGH